MKKIIALLLAAVMVMCLFAGCASSGSKVIKIGVFEPQSGDNGAGGKQEVLGIQYANSVKPTVTINGEEYKIELDIQDNQSSTDKAVSAAQQLVADKVSVVLGSYGSGVSIAAGSTFADNKIVAVGCSCTNPQVTADNDFYFRVYNKLTQDIKVPFKMEGGTRVDDTSVHQALREALANCLVNADYYGRQGLVIIKKRNSIIMSNPGNFRIEIDTAKSGGVSDPRNGTMLKMLSLTALCCH